MNFRDKQKDKKRKEGGEREGKRKDLNETIEMKGVLRKKEQKRNGKSKQIKKKGKIGRRLNLAL